MKNNQTGRHRFQHRLHEIIFEADTRAGKLFDIILIVSIVSSALVVMLDSVTALRNLYSVYFYGEALNIDPGTSGKPKKDSYIFNDHFDAGGYFRFSHVRD
ncbi:MAG: hypothetical protein KAH62_02640 [Desulfobacula sp.]|nr:hypothetical protein [Desulfobacula sp.]